MDLLRMSNTAYIQSLEHFQASGSRSAFSSRIKGISKNPLKIGRAKLNMQSTQLGTVYNLTHLLQYQNSVYILMYLSRFCTACVTVLQWQQTKSFLYVVIFWIFIILCHYWDMDVSLGKILFFVLLLIKGSPQYLSSFW